MRASPLPLAVAACVLWIGCDSPAPGRGPTSSAAPGASAGPQAPSAAVAEPPKAPEIIVDRANVDVGKNRVSAGRGLADRAGALLHDAPGIEGRVIDVVAMRSASPSDVAAVVEGLRRIKASGVNVKTEARDSTTQALPLTLSTRLPDCATVAWIAKDASIEVWPAGGGTPKRVLRGLAGPDLTLGMEAIHKQGSECEATQFAVGADDAMSWGLVFDLATTALHQAWTRTDAVLLVTGATPGRRVPLP